MQEQSRPTKYEIPLSELTFSTSTSGGPGGQHANRTESSVTVSWNPGESSYLNSSERARVIEVLGNRINKEGVLSLKESSERSQHQNKDTVIKRLNSIVTDALKPQKERKESKPPRWVNEQRLEGKKQNQQKKRRRQKPTEDGD